MNRLNYHHLQYFWQVVKVGNLTKTAEKLHVSQSALSTQIKQLESSLECELFKRQGRKLVLTEMGNVAFSYAESIFSKGNELEKLLLKGFESEVRSIHIGVLSTMSRNFIDSFVEPILGNHEVNLEITSAGQSTLLSLLANHQIDLLLTNIDVRGSSQELWESILLNRQPVHIIGHAGLELKPIFSKRYEAYDWILPSSENPIRAAFDGLCALHQVEPQIIAEANDMAMLRLLARDSRGLTVMPEVVVKDELKNGILQSYCELPEVFENFYAVTVKKHFRKNEINSLINKFLTNKKEQI